MLSCLCSQPLSRIYNRTFLLPAGPQMPLCLPGEMMGKQKTVLIVNLHLVTEETDFGLWKPLLSANAFGALADNGFALVTWVMCLSDSIFKSYDPPCSLPESLNRQRVSA